MFNQRDQSDTLGHRAEPEPPEANGPRIEIQALTPHLDRPAEEAPVEAAPRSKRPFRRSDVYGPDVAGGREHGGGLAARIAQWLDGALSGGAGSQEAQLDALLVPGRTLTRPNVVSVVSPKGGVGKTTCTFLLGNLLADRLRLRCVAIDANPDFGTLGALAPDAARPRASLGDLLEQLDDVTCVAELSPYMACLPTGLHVLCAPARAEDMARLDAEMYRELTAFLGRFYDVILLDLGTGITEPLAAFGIGQADQLVVVTTPEWVTARGVLDALRHLDGEGVRQITVALNLVDEARGISPDAVTAEFARLDIERHAAIPHDPRLRLMLDSATYRLDDLSRPVRIPIKQLAVRVAGQLV